VEEGDVVPIDAAGERGAVLEEVLGILGSI
jgi:hypothetical protein